MERYYKRPANSILLMESKAVKVEDNGLGGKDFDYCIGDMDGDLFVVKFGIEGTDVWKKIFFNKKYKKEIDAYVHVWIDHPILNRSGLASLIWNPDEEGKTPNELRRRLENRAERNTFTEKEKADILAAVKGFVDEVVFSLKK